MLIYTAEVKTAGSRHFWFRTRELAQTVTCCLHMDASVIQSILIYQSQGTCCCWTVLLPQQGLNPPTLHQQSDFTQCRSCGRQWCRTVICILAVLDQEVARKRILQRFVEEADKENHFMLKRQIQLYRLWLRRVPGDTSLQRVKAWKQNLKVPVPLNTQSTAESSDTSTAAEALCTALVMFVWPILCQILV